MIYNKEINGVNFTFVCESWGNRNAWGHKVTLYKNESVVVGTYKVRYYNRTWETFKYQSAIKGMIYKVIKDVETTLRKMFKHLHGYKIMTAKRSQEFASYLKQDKTYTMYNELYGMF